MLYYSPLGSVISSADLFCDLDTVAGEEEIVSSQEQSETLKYTSEEELRKVVRGIVVELAPDPSGKDSESGRLIEDFGYHSLALLELAFALEDEFDLKPIDEPTAREITNVKDIENHVVKELKAAGRCS